MNSSNHQPIKNPPTLQINGLIYPNNFSFKFQIARNPSLMLQFYSKPVTKSWRTEPNKCSKSSNPTLPWLELSSSTQEYSQNQPHKFNISFRTGFDPYRRWRDRPVIYGYYHFLGCSYGLLISKSNWDCILCDPVSHGWWPIPTWDNRIPFLCSSLSSMPKIDNKKNQKNKNTATLVVLTGIPNPAFAYYRIRESGDWIKKDSNLIDPNNHKGHPLKFSNGIWFKRKFYALSLQGAVAVIEEIDSDLRITDLGKKSIVPSISCIHFKECLFGSEEKILLVFLISRNSIKVVDFVEVYELDTDKLAWNKKENLKNKTLFVSTNCCMFTSWSKLGYKGNSVYFSNGDGWWVYEMETGNISPCCSIPVPDDS